VDLIFILKAIVIAIVEGITEFIPVSSTGHMIIVGDLIGFESNEFTKMFEVVIQLGAILAIVVLFWGKLFGLLKSLLRKEESGIKFTKAFLIGSIPAVIFGFALEDAIDTYLFQTWTVLAGLVVGAFLLLYAEKRFRDKATVMEVDQITWKQAIMVGLFQCLAMWPGMSRSSSTIVGGWVNGFSSKVAAEFSFFLAIPIMFGASLVKVIKFQKETGLQTLDSTEIASFGLGFVVAFVVALLCVKGFVTYIKKKPMKIFAYYRIGVSVVLAILALTGVITI
jgi:undecaprenyl-diphosphatase